ncbi:hypothetical protein AtDm6_2247 [Acetobacter tropicalis]|uniref:Uncharacterized protein n=1 Tax=Acetobacter tropicalis TaxID=104102 RepID=A0A094ZJN5_9PROT|nr:hypothetical protein AtDm6_2247 [Acetobacter tropicalis]
MPRDVRYVCLKGSGTAHSCVEGTCSLVRRTPDAQKIRICLFSLIYRLDHFEGGGLSS